MDDFIVIGSGFGGSVSALRLTEKGYRVRVIEAGRRFAPSDFPTTNWKLRDFLWLPRLGCTGIQRITLLNDVLVLSGAGVGGGSLVYGNTLLVPRHEAFHEAQWPRGVDWPMELAPFYAEAERMLGVTSHAVLGAGDDALRRYAQSIGRAGEISTTPVGIYFGTPGETVADPYFNGAGPARTGCTMCGGCMVGCRVGAKNTLDRNYLYLAEQGGAIVEPEREVTDVAVHPDGGYVVRTRPSTGWRRTPTQELRARGVVFAAGVLGTTRLLLSCRTRGSLPTLSHRIGDFVRTNSEALTGARKPGSREFSRGIAIASHLQVDQHTSIEVVRYPEGSDAMGLLATHLVGPGTRITRPLKLILAALTHPIRTMRASWPVGWARESVILLVMQTLPNRMRLRLKRRWWWPSGQRLVSEREPGVDRVPSFVPAANAAAEGIARDLGGVAVGALNEALFDVGTTAHILGGCPMGRSADDGVLDTSHRVFGYDNMYVVDGSAVPANLGVNPSLTITAMAERAMSLIPPAHAAS